jgi:hypothetical protein
MSKYEENRQLLRLLAEYRTLGVRKLYKGPLNRLNKVEGFAWKSLNQNRWCFIPLKTSFTTDNIFRVDHQHLFNL